MLPLKLAVLPVIDKLTDKLLVRVLAVTLTSVWITLLPKLELPVAVIALVTVRLPLPSKVAVNGSMLPTEVV